MKIGYIVEPNSKGQIVIPKSVRDKFRINPKTSLNLVIRGRGMYLTPIRQVISGVDEEASYLEILKKTKGAWGRKDDEIFKRRRKTELSASQRRKKRW